MKRQCSLFIAFLTLVSNQSREEDARGNFFFIERQCWLFFRIQSKLTNPQFALLSENFCNLIWSKNVAHQREIAYQSLIACESTTLPVIAGAVSVRKRPDNRDSSKDVFDRRSSTGSRLFAFWVGGFAQIFGQIVYTMVTSLSTKHFLLSRPLKKERASIRSTCVAQKRLCLSLIHF